MHMHMLSLLKTWSTGLALFMIGFTFISAHAGTASAHSVAPVKPAAAPAVTAATASKTAESGVVKMAVKPGVSLDEAGDSMRLRANALNMKLVAELPLSSQVEAITGKPQRRATIFQFCDALTAKDLIELNIDFAIYMPCRIALIEDAKGQAWLIMMDIDVDAVAHEKGVPAELKKRIQEVRATLINIMEAGAKGDL